MARRLFNDMPNSAAYRRPRSVSCSGSRNVIAIGELLAVWYHYDTCNRYSFANHRYAAFLTLPVSKYSSSGVR